MTQSEAIEKMNQLGKERIPFFFMVDFLGNRPMVVPLSEVNSDEILYNINGTTNLTIKNADSSLINRCHFQKKPIEFQRYQQAFEKVVSGINLGNSYLLNLTFPSSIETNLSLKEIFHHSNAPYRLWFRDQFVVFSPEIFVKIKGGVISSYPMKGTIDASIPNAEQIILNDRKEKAEHATIVDLIRNDLSLVARNVTVDQFRYIDHLKTNNKDLLQVSSKISGVLPDNFQKKLGSILFSMLPAGSVTGAPKQKTLEIILEAEQYDRGYYTGIFGIFDGKNIDSSVMIRFIENTPQGMLYKSGGGITSFSEPEKEYQELIDKIYVPIT